MPRSFAELDAELAAERLAAAPRTYREFGRLPTYKREAVRIAQLRHQAGACGLCPKQVEVEDRHLLYVDHHHASDRLRGLLCPGCNNAMHGVDRGDEWLAQAVLYRDLGLWYAPPRAVAHV